MAKQSRSNWLEKEYDLELTKDDKQLHTKLQEASFKEFISASKIGAGAKNIDKFLKEWKYK